MERIQPHAGPGREPARVITGESLNLGGVNQTVYASPDPSGGGMVALNPQGAPLRTSTPPPAPQSAAELAALRTDVARLTSTLGEMRAQQELERMETALRLEATLAGAPGGTRAPHVALPPGVSPEDSLNVGQLLAVMGEVFPTLQAQAIRSGWGVSADEEAQVLQQNPNLNQVPEPRRSQLIKSFVDLKRAHAPSAPTQPERTAQVRDAAPTVPVTEYPSSPTMAAALEMAGGGDDQVTLAWQWYRELEGKLSTVRTPKERRQVLAEMKQAMVLAAQAQGTNLDQLGLSSWKQE